MGIPSGFELLIILLVIMLLFGASRLPKLARSMGQAGKEFKAGLKEGAQAPPVEGPCPFCGTELNADVKFCSGCGRSADDVVAEKSRRAQESKAS